MIDRTKMRRLIKEALEKLVENDSDTFNLGLPKLGQSTEKERRFNRELHETTLNHRLALYLELGLWKENITEYNIDIEYNRNFSDQKRVKIGKIRIPVRPDILIHKRMKINEKNPHLLVVEAKKHKISNHDLNKIKGFMTDPRYLYEYGLTVSYAYNPRIVLATFYYKENISLRTELIEVPRII